jgi:hypothetical protein
VIAVAVAYTAVIDVEADRAGTETHAVDIFMA